MMLQNNQTGKKTLARELAKVCLNTALARHGPLGFCLASWRIAATHSSFKVNRNMNSPSDPSRSLHCCRGVCTPLFLSPNGHLLVSAVNMGKGASGGSVTHVCISIYLSPSTTTCESWVAGCRGRGCSCSHQWAWSWNKTVAASQKYIWWQHQPCLFWMDPILWMQRFTRNLIAPAWPNIHPAIYPANLNNGTFPPLLSAAWWAVCL